LNIFELTVTIGVPVGSILALGLYLHFRIPKLIQSVLNDVAGQINEIFANPTIKKAYSVLGSKSGEVRADEATRNKFAEALIGEMPALGMILERFDLTPIEALKLYNDPLIGPILQRFIGGFMQNVGKRLNMPEGISGMSSSGEMS